MLNRWNSVMSKSMGDQRSNSSFDVPVKCHKCGRMLKNQKRKSPLETCKRCHLGK
jgi:acetyl-CoA carboxylase beta subunit